LGGAGILGFRELEAQKKRARGSNRGVAMGEVELDLRIPVSVDPRSNAQVAVMAMISEEDFRGARLVIPDLAAQGDYQDWLDSREGFQMGLAMAGVDVKMMFVTVSQFLTWCRHSQTTPSESALDAFASLLALLTRPPAVTSAAAVRRGDFDVYRREVEAFAAHADYDEWLEHREARLKNLIASGAHVESFPICVRDFVAWSKCVGERTTEGALDRYVTLTLEFLTEHEKA
jgi:hypothetical protein